MMFDGFDDPWNRLEAALFESAEDARRDGLAVGASPTAVAVTVYTEDDRRADRPLGMVVVEGSSRLVEKGDMVVLMPPEPAASSGTGRGCLPTAWKVDCNYLQVTRLIANHVSGATSTSPRYDVKDNLHRANPIRNNPALQR